MIGGPESSNLINASFNLINTSDSPIMVSSVQASCGCTKMDWDGGILKAGEKKEVKFSVIPGNKEMEPVEMKVEVFQRDFYRLNTGI